MHEADSMLYAKGFLGLIILFTFIRWLYSQKSMYIWAFDLKFIKHYLKGNASFPQMLWFILIWQISWGILGIFLIDLIAHLVSSILIISDTIINIIKHYSILPFFLIGIIMKIVKIFNK